MSLYRKEIEVFPSFSSAVEVFCPFFRRRVCSLKVTSLPFELVVLFFVQGSREILLMFLLLLFTLSCTMEELASQGTNFPYQRRKLMALSSLRNNAPANFYQPLSQRIGWNRKELRQKPVRADRRKIRRVGKLKGNQSLMRV